MIPAINQTAVFFRPASLSSSSVNPNDFAPPTGEIKSALDQHIKGKQVLVFSGFSGMGYDDVEAFQTSLESTLKEASLNHGKHNVVVVAGATSVGIGAVYSLAKKLEIKTLGIVSEQAKGGGEIASSCDDVIYVPEKKGSWQVLYDIDKAKGLTGSYMTYVASKASPASGGEFFAFGGGDVTVSELKEAKKLGITTRVYPDFQPNRDKVKERQANKPGSDMTPVKTYMTQVLE
ncbi:MULTISPECIES: hypothetical protein [Yersinia]|uniref:hypothetical protein n=1 Tax=Yersinia TaxID=629 RepID=UPI0013CE3025|nr:hypothetical protein [Yersinia sp. IP36721]